MAGTCFYYTSSYYSGVGDVERAGINGDNRCLLVGWEVIIVYLSRVILFIRRNHLPLFVSCHFYPIDGISTHPSHKIMEQLNLNEFYVSVCSTIMVSFTLYCCVENIQDNWDDDDIDDEFTTQLRAELSKSE